MGMFDKIYVEKKLFPKDNPFYDLITDKTVFQTKDLDCSFQTYYIKEDGLYCEGKKIDYHGWIDFYTILDNKLIEFSAKFTDGDLIDIFHSVDWTKY